MQVPPVKPDALCRPATAPRWPVLAALAFTTACSPAFDWREARIDGPGLVALFPCRPVAQTRQVELAGRRLSMQLQACETSGQTFGVTLVDVGDPAAVGPVLLSLRSASEAKAAASAQGRPASVVPAGATPQAAAGRWQLDVPAPGRPMRLDTALFARGTWVIQASVIGQPAADGLIAPFFEGLRFAP